MKRTVTLFLVFSVLTLFVACEKNAVARYAGTYTGTLSSHKLIKENVELRFEKDDSKTHTLALFGIPLKKEEINRYTTGDTVVLNILQIAYPRLARGQIANMSALFVFEENEVSMDLAYSVVNNPTNLNLCFIGKKN